MRRIWLRHPPVGVSHMCWMAPEPAMSAITNVSPGPIRTNGETFHPSPRSRAAAAPVPSVAMPPRPFSPVKFSGLIERVSASASRHRFARPTPSPFHSLIYRQYYKTVGTGTGSRQGVASAAMTARRILTVHAHPDDESSKGAATIASYAAAGVHTVLVCCTGGEAGDILNPDADTEEARTDLAAVRARELDAAVGVIGYHRLDKLGYRDSG